LARKPFLNVEEKILVENVFWQLLFGRCLFKKVAAKARPTWPVMSQAF